MATTTNVAEDVDEDVERFFARFYHVHAPSIPTYRLSVRLVLNDAVEDVLFVSSKQHSYVYQSPNPSGDTGGFPDFVTEFVFKKGTTIALSRYKPRLQVDLISFDPGGKKPGIIAQDDFYLTIKPPSGLANESHERCLHRQIGNSSNVAIAKYSVDVSRLRPVIEDQSSLGELSDTLSDVLEFANLPLARSISNISNTTRIISSSRLEQTTKNVDSYSNTLSPEEHSCLIADLHMMSEAKRDAVTNNIDALIHIKTSVENLQAENENLSAQVAIEQELAKTFLEEENLESAPRTKLIRAYTEAVERRNFENSNVMKLKQRILQLQNDLIAQNDHEKLHLALESEHLRVNAKVQGLQSKARKVALLETTAAQQQSIIHKLEQLVSDAPGIVLDPETRIKSVAYEKLVESIGQFGVRQDKRIKYSGYNSDGKESLR